MNTVKRRGMTATLGALCAACCLAVAPGPAGAHARLLRSLPAAGATVAAPMLITLRFNEALEGRLSTLKLSVTGRAVAAVPSTDADPAALAIVPVQPLAAGTYLVSWSAVSQDGHRTRGAFSFTVK